jgi:uncharacterized Fe-S center protein
MPSQVYWGSPRQARLRAEETLPAKLDLIINHLHIRDRVKDETVAIKIHTGNNIGYSTAHPVFVRKVVQAVRDGGGKPFVCDLKGDVKGAEGRGYTAETLGCPIYPVAGPDEKYFYLHHRPYKNIQDWQVAGMIQDASFIINFAHVKGHPSCGMGAAIKNIALGCMAHQTRSAMHDTMQFDQYWFREKCADPEMVKRIVDACPHNGIVVDKNNPQDIHLHPEECNACGRCLKIAPPGSLKIDVANFNSFMEACAISTQLVYSTFAKEKITNLALATHMTPVCDCFGFTSMPILPDAGVFGSDDIVALDQAILDKIAETRLIEENVPTAMEVHTREGHPLRWLHGPLKNPYMVTEYGEQYGLGTRQYELIDVLPVERFPHSTVTYIPA